MGSRQNASSGYRLTSCITGQRRVELSIRATKFRGGSAKHSGFTLTEEKKPLYLLALSLFRTENRCPRFPKMRYRIDTLRAPRPLTERVIDIRIRRIITELAGHSGAASSQCADRALDQPFERRQKARLPFNGSFAATATPPDTRAQLIAASLQFRNATINRARRNPRRRRNRRHPVTAQFQPLVATSQQERVFSRTGCARLAASHGALSDPRSLAKTDRAGRRMEDRFFQRQGAGGRPPGRQRLSLRRRRLSQYRRRHPQSGLPSQSASGSGRS